MSTVVALSFMEKFSSEPGGERGSGRCHLLINLFLITMNAAAVIVTITIATMRSLSGIREKSKGGAVGTPD